MEQKNKIDWGLTWAFPQKVINTTVEDIGYPGVKDFLFQSGYSACEVVTEGDYPGG